MTTELTFTRIKPPKYRIGRYILNEYELRKVMLEVAQGLKPAWIKVKDIYGNVAEIRPDGALAGDTLYGFAINSRFTLDMLGLRRDIERGTSNSMLPKGKYFESNAIMPDGKPW